MTVAKAFFDASNRDVFWADREARKRHVNFVLLFFLQCFGERSAGRQHDLGALPFLWLTSIEGTGRFNENLQKRFNRTLLKKKTTSISCALHLFYVPLQPYCGGFFRSVGAQAQAEQNQKSGKANK